MVMSDYVSVCQRLLTLVLDALYLTQMIELMRK